MICQAGGGKGEGRGQKGGQHNHRYRSENQHSLQYQSLFIVQRTCMLRIYSFFVMISLDANEFLCDGGIFECTIDQLYNCDEFFLQRELIS